MGAVSSLLFRQDQWSWRVALAAAFVVALSLYALLVVSGEMSVVPPPDEQLVAPFRWFYGDSATA